MALITDANRHLRSSSTEDVGRVKDGDALSERIYEWLETPMGTLADIPEWGHNLAAFKFEPQSVNLEVAIEMALVAKMEQDIEDLKVLGVSVEYVEIDLFKIAIRHQFGATVANLEL